MSRTSGPGGRLRLAALGLALLAASSAPAAEGDSPIGTIMNGLTGGGSRRDLMDRIERSENERARQQAERAATEIRGLRARAAALDAQIADLDHLATSPAGRCGAI